MKKFFFAAVVALVSLVCISANAESTAVPVDNYSSSITVNLAGAGEGINFETGKLVLVYNLMPQKVKDLCVASYKAIAQKIEKYGTRSFTYEGVTITPVNANGRTDLEFSCQGHTLTVENYNRVEFDAIFGL